MKANPPGNKRNPSDIVINRAGCSGGGRKKPLVSATTSLRNESISPNSTVQEAHDSQHPAGLSLETPQVSDGCNAASALADAPASSLECSGLVDCIRACEKCPVAGGEDVVVGADVLAEGVLQARHRAPPLRLDTVSLLSCSAQGLLSGSTKRVSSRARQSGPPLGLGKQGLLSGSSQGFSQTRHRGESSVTAVRASSQGRHRGPPLRLCTGFLLGLSREGLLLGSEKRASSQPRYRRTPLTLNTEGLLSGSVERSPFRARKRGPPPRLDTKGLLSSSTQRASSQTRHRRAFCVQARHRG